MINRSAFVSCFLTLWVMFVMMGCSTLEPISDSSVSIEAQSTSANYTLPASLSSDIHEAYNSGKPLLLFAYSEKIVDSEAYADWAYYLNDFKQHQGAEFFYAQVDAASFTSIPSDDLTGFSLFVKKGHSAYWYDGLIVEPQVYMSVFKTLANQALNGMDKAFMPEVVNGAP